jgi:UDP-glucose 4-epimerase
MRCLVTGGTGFIGRQLVHTLNELGHEVICLVRQPLLSPRAGIEVVVGDLLDRDLGDVLERKVGQIDIVFHAGAILPAAAPADPALFLDANGTATLRLLEFCRRREVTKFTYLSSISVIGVPGHTPVDEAHSLLPTNPYSLGKLVGELACNVYRSASSDIASLRVTSPYGPGMPRSTVLPRFVDQALQRGLVTWYGSGSRSQDFIHVDDVVAACVWTLNNGVTGTFNLAAGTPTSMRELAEMIVENVPEAQALSAEQSDPQEDMRWEIEVEAARRLGFEAKISLANGLEDYIKSITEGRKLQPWWH